MKYKKPRKGKWIILSISLLLGLVALWTINSFAKQIRLSEQEKVRLWANAISQKSELMSSTETFFNEVGIDFTLMCYSRSTRLTSALMQSSISAMCLILSTAAAPHS